MTILKHNLAEVSNDPSQFLGEISLGLSAEMFVYYCRKMYLNGTMTIINQSFSCEDITTSRVEGNLLNVFINCSIKRKN